MLFQQTQFKNSSRSFSFEPKNTIIYINIASEVEEEYKKMSNYSKILIINKLMLNNTNNNIYITSDNINL